MASRRLLETTPPTLQTSDVDAVGISLSTIAAVLNLATLTALLPVQGAIFRKTHDPASTLYPPGVTVVQTYNPATNYRAILPLRWSLSAKVGNVQWEVKFVFSDDSTVTVANSTGGTVVSSIDGQDFNKDGLYIKQIVLQANNVDVADDTQDLGAATINGINLL